MTCAAGPRRAGGTQVTLTAMLNARNHRFERQRTALRRFDRPLVSVTLVMPGPEKDTPLTRRLMEVAAAELQFLFGRRGWRVVHAARVTEMTGIEALYVVDTDAVPLKLAVCELEQSHPLGRLWDMDVFCPAHGRLSRRGLGFPPRRCLICGEPAHACARAQRHPLAELLAAIQETVDGYSFCPVG